MNKEQMVSLTVAERIASRPFLPFSLPDAGNEAIWKVAGAITSGCVATGNKTKQFELEFAATVGARHAIAVNSCTAAMHIALEAAGVGKGDEVITTPYTFAATASVIRYFDATPVFVDVDPETLNIDPAQIESAVTEKTKVILPVHLAGLPADMESIRAVADKFHLSVIEDAAHAFLAKYNGTRIGNLSDMTCFSFSGTETNTTGAGGMLCTENDEFAERCSLMAMDGISSDAWKRHGAEGAWYYEIVAPGFRYKMNDNAAAVGLAQMKHASAAHERRRAIAHKYNAGFSHFPHFQLPKDDARHKHAWHLYMLRLNLENLTIDRALFVEELTKRHIGVNVHFIPLHIHPYYKQQYGYKPEDFAVAYNEYLREISLPIYSKMTDTDVEDVIDAVIDILMQFGR